MDTHNARKIAKFEHAQENPTQVGKILNCFNIALDLAGSAKQFEENHTFYH